MKLSAGTAVPPPSHRKIEKWRGEWLVQDEGGSQPRPGGAGINHLNLVLMWRGKLARRGTVYLSGKYWGWKKG